MTTPHRACRKHSCHEHSEYHLVLTCSVRLTPEHCDRRQITALASEHTDGGRLLSAERNTPARLPDSPVRARTQTQARTLRHRHALTPARTQITHARYYAHSHTRTQAPTQAQTAQARAHKIGNAYACKSARTPARIRVRTHMCARTHTACVRKHSRSTRSRSAHAWAKTASASDEIKYTMHVRRTFPSEQCTNTTLCSSSLSHASIEWIVATKSVIAGTLCVRSLAVRELSWAKAKCHAPRPNNTGFGAVGSKARGCSD